jgi:putative inorganic carbon (hco3(-)) transporter
MPARTVIQDRAWWAFFILLGLGFGYMTASQLFLGFGVIGGVLALLVVVFCVAEVTWGLYILTAYVYYNSGIALLLTGSHFQAGIPYDILLLLTLIGAMVRKTRLRTSAQEFFRSPVIKWWLVLFGYIILEVANPYVHSPQGWLDQIRKSSEELLLLFIAFTALDTPARIRQFLQAFFWLTVLLGFYGCIQQWHGLTQNELTWVRADENRFGLLFVGGDFRKFSTLADPTTFGIIMASGAACYLIIALAQKIPWRRNLLIAGCMIMMLAMAYSGTRTANVVLLAGLAMYLLLNADKTSTWVFGIAMTGMLVVLVNLPIYSNMTLNRFRTTFQGKNDASFNVRELSRHFIQPYMYDHPIGGGLGTTNTYGKNVNPGHYLAGFQTDDGYLLDALEIGPIGLLLVLIWIFVVLRAGIQGYFRAKNPETRNLYIAVLAAIVPFVVSMLTQEVIGQMSNDAVFFPMIALLMRLDVMEKKASL